MGYKTIHLRASRKQVRMVRVRLEVDDDVNLTRPEVREGLMELLEDLVQCHFDEAEGPEDYPEAFQGSDGWVGGSVEVERIDNSYLPCNPGDKHEFSAAARRFLGHKVRVELESVDPEPLEVVPLRQERPKYRLRILSYEEWLAEGRELYGPDMDDWRFECPSCGILTSVRRWRDLGAPDGSIGFSCEGRWALEGTVVGKLMGDVKPCDYTGGGLLNLNPVTVQMPDGSSRLMFPFADSELKLENGSARVKPARRVRRPSTAEMKIPKGFKFPSILDDNED